MKKTLTIVLAVFLLIAAVGVTAFALNQNDDGVYEIATAEDLIAFRDLANKTQGLKAKLVDDIDMAGVEWTPFDNVVMDFDGNGKTISNLTRTVTANGGCHGLFANLLNNGGGKYSYLHDVTFKDCSFTVSTNTMTHVGLVGGANRASFVDIALENVDITVSHGNNELSVGAVVGLAMHATDIGDSMYIPVSATVDEDSSITVTSTGTTNMLRIGGLVGINKNATANFESCAFNGTITAPAGSLPGAIIGKSYGASFIIHNCENGTDLPECQTKIDTNESVTPVTVVWTAEEYLEIVSGLNEAGGDYTSESIFIGADLDFDGLDFQPITVTYQGAFFHGLGHTFSNIHKTYTSIGSGLIFKLTKGSASVMSLTIKDSSVTLNANERDAFSFGGVTASADRTRFADIHFENFDVTLTGTYGAGTNVGGLVGYAAYSFSYVTENAMAYYNCTLDKDSSVTVLGTSRVNLGGFAGTVRGERYSVLNCENHAAITSSAGNSLVGGFFGHGSGAGTNGDNTIKNSANYGAISSPFCAGAFVGDQGGAKLTVTNSVAGGFINGTTVGAFVGAGQQTTVDANSRGVAIINPLTADGAANLAGYAQTADAGAGMKDLRVVFLTKTDYVLEKQTLNINFTFYNADGDEVKAYTDTLGKEVYLSVKAAGDVYYAPDGMVMFGNIITGIPTAEAESVVVTVTDADGEEVFSSDYFDLVD